MNPRPHAQQTKSFLAYGAGLLSLCVGATVIFFTLQPLTDTLDGYQPEKNQTRHPVKARVAESHQVPLTAVALPNAEAPAPIHPSRPDANGEYRVEGQESQATQPTTGDEHAIQPVVEVIAPGRIRLTEEQQELLKGHGSSWGNTNPEAEAVLRSIPKEAFTSDW